MGSSLAWFIVESNDAAAVAAVLDVKITGRTGPRRGFPIAFRRLPDGRLLVVSNNCDEPLFKSKQLGAIARLGRTCSGMMEEHVMARSFAAWGNGRKTWSIRHQGDDDPLHLKTTGRLPAHVAAQKDVALEKQKAAGEAAEEDLLFELPLELARQVAKIDPYEDVEGEFEQLHIGFWRELWRRTFWWRLLLGFIAGGMVFIYGFVLVGKLLRWILELLGWR